MFQFVGRQFFFLRSLLKKVIFLWLSELSLLCSQFSFRSAHDTLGLMLCTSLPFKLCKKKKKTWVTENLSKWNRWHLHSRLLSLSACLSSGWLAGCLSCSLHGSLTDDAHTVPMPSMVYLTNLCMKMPL